MLILYPKEETYFRTWNTFNFYEGMIAITSMSVYIHCLYMYLLKKPISRIGEIRMNFNKLFDINPSVSHKSTKSVIVLTCTKIFRIL